MSVHRLKHHPVHDDALVKEKFRNPFEPLFKPLPTIKLPVQDQGQSDCVSVCDDDYSDEASDDDMDTGQDDETEFVTYDYMR